MNVHTHVHVCVDSGKRTADLSLCLGCQLACAIRR